MLLCYCAAEACIEGSVRLIPSATSTSAEYYRNPHTVQESYFLKDEVRVGRVEVCMGGIYGTICGDQWSNVDGSVICHQLGFSRYGEFSRLAISRQCWFSVSYYPCRSHHWKLNI